jgi:hypothetical protein
LVYKEVTNMAKKVSPLYLLCKKVSGLLDKPEDSLSDDEKDFILRFEEVNSDLADSVEAEEGAEEEAEEESPDSEQAEEEVIVEGAEPLIEDEEADSEEEDEDKPSPLFSALKSLATLANPG